MGTGADIACVWLNIVIPFAKTAREAVLLLGAAVEQYGSAECNTVLIGDADDIWIVEIISGHNRAAARGAG